MELKSGESVEFDNGRTHTVISIQRIGFWEDLAGTLKWHASARKTRKQARNAVEQLNLLPERRALEFSYEPRSDVNYPYNQNCARIIVDGIEDVVNDFFLGAVLNDLYHDARFEAGANGCYVAAPEGQLIIPVWAGEADQARKIATGFVAKYNAAHDVLANAKGQAPTDEAENVKQTMILTGYTRTLDCAPLIRSHALGLKFAKMTPYQKETTRQMLGFALGGTAPA